MTDVKKTVHKKKRKKLRLNLMTILVAVVAVFAVLFIVASTFGSVAFSNVTDVFSGFFSTVGKGEEFPYSIDEQRTARISAIDSNLIVPCTDGTSIITPSAAERLKLDVKYTNPVADIHGGRAVIFDRNGTHFSVVSKSKILSQNDTEHAILDAAISGNGYVAVATLTDDSACTVTVFNRQLREYFKWKCISDYVSDIAFSNNGRSLAVSVVGVSGAEILSKLWIFDLKSSEPVSTFEYAGTAIIDVEFTRNSSVRVIGDNLISVITNKTERAPDISFGGDTLSCFGNSSGGKSAVVLMPYGNDSAAKLSVYGKDNAKSFEKSFSKGAVSVSCSPSYTAILFKDEAVILNNAGETVGKITLDEPADDIIAASGNIFVRFSDRIEKYPASGNTK